MNKGQMMMLQAGIDKVLDLTQKSRNIKLKYLLLYNKDVVLPECNRLKKLDAATSEFKDFQNKRIKLNESCAIKDKDKKPVIINNNYQIDPNLTEDFNKKIVELEKEYENVIKERKEAIENYNKYLDGDVEKSISDNLKKVKIEDLEKEELVKDEPTVLFEYLLPILEN